MFSHSAKAKCFGRSKLAGPSEATVLQGGGQSGSAQSNFWSYFLMWIHSSRVMTSFHLQLARSWLHFWVIHRREHCLLKWNWQPWSILGISLYKLEGDKPLVFQCYKNVSVLTASVNIANFSNLNAVAKELSADNAMIEQQLTVYRKICINPAVQYYQQRLKDSMRIPLQAFKATRVFVPSKVQEMNIDTQAVDSLAVFPFFDSVEPQHLKTELPNYIAACEDVDSSHDVCTFWKNHKRTLPHWSACCL